MNYQKIFKRSYADELLENAKQGIGIEAYEQPLFECNQEAILHTTQIIESEGLEQTMLCAETDLQAAIALFEAYPRLTLLQAQDPVLWVTLAHTDLFTYVKKRWPLTGNAEDKRKAILAHWFSTDLMRQALSNLWWSVYLSRDEKAEAPYRLTEFLFRNQTFRTRVFGSSSLFRHKPAAIGILSYMVEKQHCFDSLEIQGRAIASYFNSLGAFRLLSGLDSSYFYDTMKRQSVLTNYFTDCYIEDETTNTTESDNDE